MNVFDKGLITLLVSNVLFCLIALPLILRKVPPNPVYGYRTRAILSNDTLWYDVNAYFGVRLFVVSILSACLAVAIDAWRGIPPDIYLTVSIVLLAAPVTVAGLLTTRFVRAAGPGHSISKHAAGGS